MTVDDSRQAIPDPALVVLVGPAGSGKPTWAGQRYRPQEVVSSDELRAVVGSGEHDLDASADAFALLDQIVAARLRRGLTTVVDTLGLDAGAAPRLARRWPGRPGCRPWPCCSTPTPPLCRRRNRGARPAACPPPVLDGQLRRMRGAAAELARRGLGPGHPAATPAADRARAHPRRHAAPPPSSDRAPARLGFVLQVSRFPLGRRPGRLAGRGGRAPRPRPASSGIALMDHLIQIPQVGRAWEPIPEPWVTLGLLAGPGHRAAARHAGHAR